MTATFKTVSYAEISEVFTFHEGRLFQDYIGKPHAVHARVKLQRSRNHNLEPFVTVRIEGFTVDVPECFCTLNG